MLPLGPAAPGVPEGPGGPRGPGKPGAPAIPAAPCRVQQRVSAMYVYDKKIKINVTIDHFLKKV